MSAVFDASRLARGGVALIVGRRGAGKTFLVRNLARSAAAGMAYPMAFSCDPDAERVLNFVPSACVRSDFDAQAVSNALRAYQSVCAADTAKGRLCLLFDDTLFQRASDTASMRDVWRSALEQRSVLILSTHEQCPRALPSASLERAEQRRCQADYVFLLGETSERERHRLYAMFARDAFASEREFGEALDAATLSHGCLVLDHSDITCVPRVFCYRAEATVLPFRMGLPAFWTLCANQNPVHGHG